MKYIYSFSEGKKDMKDLLGGKGANLSEMSSLGLPVPPGFIIATDACALYYDDKKEIREDIQKEILEKLKNLHE